MCTCACAFDPLLLECDMFLFLCNVRLPLLVLHNCVVSVVALLEIGMDVRGSRSQGEGTGAQGFRAAATAVAATGLLSSRKCCVSSFLSCSLAPRRLLLLVLLGRCSGVSRVAFLLR